MAKRVHRGRIQAQGEGLEASENWAQDEPLTAEKGLWLLGLLKKKIPESEVAKRAGQFDKAEDLIKRAKQTGGIDAHFSQSFRKKGSTIRVDVEVLGGRAFVCFVTIIIIYWLFFN